MRHGNIARIARNARIAIFNFLKSIIAIFGVRSNIFVAATVEAIVSEITPRNPQPNFGNNWVREVNFCHPSNPSKKNGDFSTRAIRAMFFEPVRPENGKNWLPEVNFCNFCIPSRPFWFPETQVLRFLGSDWSIRAIWAIFGSKKKAARIARISGQRTETISGKKWRKKTTEIITTFSFWSGIEKAPKSVLQCLHYYTSVKWTFPFSLLRLIVPPERLEIITRKNCLFITSFAFGLQNTIFSNKSSENGPKSHQNHHPKKLSFYHPIFCGFS